MAHTRLHQLIETTLKIQPEKRCFTDYDGSEFNGVEVLQAVEQAELQLRAAGVRAGDRVMLVGENAVTMAAFVFACSRLDAWVIPINARQTSSELERVRAHAKPRALVFASKVSAAANTHADHFSAGPAIEETYGSARILGEQQVECEACAEDPAVQVAAMFYTTGTTGEPKGVMLSHQNLMFMAQASSKVRGLGPADKLYCCIPVTHIYAFASGMLATLYSGAEVQLASSFSPAATFEALQNGVTCMPAVPAMYAHLMDHAASLGVDKITAPKLRYIAAGGAPLDPDWKSRVEAYFGQTLHNGYGMTEASPGVAVTRYDAVPPDQACGPALPGTEILLAPAPGKDALDNGVGEVLVRGPHVMLGYYHNPEATAATLDNENFLHTGDLGKWTEDGSLEIVGRCKELIIRSGFNVYPPEVESALNSHPEVTQSAVVGRHQADGNEEVLAFVQCVPGTNPEASVLQAWTRQHLSPYKVPSIVIVAESLPAAPSGKPLKHLMISHFEDALNAASADS